MSKICKSSDRPLELANSEKSSYQPPTSGAFAGAKKHRETRLARFVCWLAVAESQADEGLWDFGKANKAHISLWITYFAMI